MTRNLEMVEREGELIDVQGQFLTMILLRLESQLDRPGIVKTPVIVNSIHPACTSNWLVMDPYRPQGIPSSFSKPRERCSQGIQDGSRVSECITGEATVYDTNPY